MSEFHELEYKYRADTVGLKEFQELMRTRPIEDDLTVSSWDIYYVKGGGDYFQRLRLGEKPELTKKRKMTDSNNWARVEVDLPLDSNRLSENIVREYVKLDGYLENFRLYKSCFIYFEKNISWVYYIVYDENMKEKGRFIEIEVDKKWAEKSLEMLSEAEALLSKFDISHRNRSKKSLFEMFRKD